SINHHEVFDMKAFADERGIEFKFDAMINPRIDCSQAPLGVRLTPEEIVELDLRDVARIEEWRRLANQFPNEPKTELYDCGGGVEPPKRDGCSRPPDDRSHRLFVLSCAMR